MQSMQNQKKHKFTTPMFLSSFQNNIPSILASSDIPSRPPSSGQTDKKISSSVTLVPFNSTSLQNSGSWVAKTPKTVQQASGKIGCFFSCDSRQTFKRILITVHATRSQLEWEHEASKQGCRFSRGHKHTKKKHEQFKKTKGKHVNTGKALDTTAWWTRRGPRQKNRTDW